MNSPQCEAAHPRPAGSARGKTPEPPRRSRARGSGRLGIPGDKSCCRDLLPNKFLCEKHLAVTSVRAASRVSPARHFSCHRRLAVSVLPPPILPDAGLHLSVPRAGATGREVAMTLCAQVGEGPLVPKISKSDFKTILQGSRARSRPFPRDQGLLTGGVQREMAAPMGQRECQAEHHSPSFSPSSKCRGWMGSPWDGRGHPGGPRRRMRWAQRRDEGSQGIDE